MNGAWDDEIEIPSLTQANLGAYLAAVAAGVAAGDLSTARAKVLLYAAQVLQSSTAAKPDTAAQRKCHPEAAVVPRRSR